MGFKFGKPEKNVPVQTYLNQKDVFGQGNWEDLAIGDSITITLDGEDTAKFKAKVRNALTTYGKRTGKKFTVRVKDEDTLRIWRLQDGSETVKGEDPVPDPDSEDYN